MDKIKKVLEDSGEISSEEIYKLFNNETFIMLLKEVINEVVIETMISSQYMEDFSIGDDSFYEMEDYNE